MSETPEPRVEPTTEATPATSVAGPPPPQPPHRVEPPRLYTAAAWVVIVAGVVFILTSLFFVGAFIWKHNYYCHHHHGMFHPGGPGPGNGPWGPPAPGRVMGLGRTAHPAATDRTTADPVVRAPTTDRGDMGPADPG